MLDGLERRKMQYFLFFLLVLGGIIIKRNRLYSYVVLFVDWLLFAFARGQADFDAYQRWYALSSMTPLQQNLLRDTEIGYQFISAVFRDVLHVDFEFFWAFFAAASLIALFNVIKRYTKCTTFVLALFSVFPFFICAVQMRSWLSIVIVLIGMRHLEGTKIVEYVKYAVYVVIASTIHFSSLFFLVFLVFKFIDEKKLFLVATIWCLAGSSLGILLLGRLSDLSGFVKKYVQVYTGGTSIITSIAMLLLLAGLFYVSLEGREVIRTHYSRSRESDINVSQNMEREYIYSELATKMCLCAFFIWPFTLLTLETIRFVRFFVIIVYIQSSIAVSYRSPYRIKQSFIKIANPIISIVLMYVFSVSGILFKTVFYPILNNNIVIEKIVDLIGF